MKNKNQIIIILAVIVIILGLVLIFKKPSSENLWNRDSWQAVFLDNNQVYFGKIDSVSDDNVYLKNIYYLQSGEAGASTLNLIKLGSEFHGPTDEMVINRESVLFWENLKSDSKVVQTIESMNK
jgi:uncharacterized protein YpmB